MTFPSPDNIESKVRIVNINGYYDKGKSRQNRAEAQAVVDEIARRLRSEELRKKSIGVVTFSIVQQALIEDLLSDLFIFHPELETLALECDEPLFIKNLENVQGDERGRYSLFCGLRSGCGRTCQHEFRPIEPGRWRKKVECGRFPCPV